MTDKYILDGRTPKPCDDLRAWARWFETAVRVVAIDEFGGAAISTVFLGIDHNFLGGRPLLFETMIFGGSHDQYQTRCSTWDEAEAAHAKAVRLVKGEFH